jgi:hypothetical protein
MIINKVTTGWVTQQFENGKFIGQSFFASDDVSFEDEIGERITKHPDLPYIPFDMVQPKPSPKYQYRDESIGQDVGPCDLCDNENTIICFYDKMWLCSHCIDRKKRLYGT